MAEHEFPNIPGYRISKQIGCGSMAVVYLAEQERVGRPVAIKVMRPDLDADPSFGDRFRREAKIVAKLVHPNIFTIYDFGTAGPYHFMSMELVPGGDLKTRIRGGAIPIMDALRITRQVAAALHFAHERGYVHRDVKPANVLFRNDGTAVLSDFGIARAASDAATRMTATGAVIGTPNYMSPEQVEAKDVNGPSDLYSLGIMLYEMLTGHVPYKGDSAISVGIKHLSEPVPQLPATFSRFQGLLEKLLAKSPNERFQDGAAIIRALDAIECNAGNDPRNFGITLLRPSGARAVIVAGIVVALVAGGFVLLRPDSPVTAEINAASASASAQNNTEPSAPRVSDQDAQQAEAERQKIAAAEKAQQAEAERLRAAEQERLRIAALEKSRQEETEQRKAAEAERQKEAEQQKIAAAEKAQQEETQRLQAVEQERLRIATLEMTRQEETERRARDEQLTHLLTQARDYLDADKLNEARAGRAIDLYRDAQRLAPNDNRVQQGPRLIAEAYATLADARVEAKRYNEAESLVLKGLEFSPGNNALLALQKSITEKKTAKKPHRTIGGF